MATLYRKYRPQNFKEVVNQNHIKLTLENEIEAGKIAHAYLFSGPRAVGKTTLARVFAKAVNCSNRKEGEHEPCDKCDSCRDIVAGRSFDIIEIDAASHTGVDNVRENIIAQARVAPAKSKHKVFIIDEVHMLSISAFNALLKIIEEPPANVIFILATTEIHKVPTTIISRCQRFDFKRISAVDITKKLSYIVKEEGIKVDKEILEAIARQSEGHMRDAESLLGQVVSIGGKEITREEAELVIPRSDLGEVINLISFLSKKDAASALGLVNKLIDEGIDLKTFLSDLVEVLRKILFAKISPALAEKLGLEFGETIEIKINETSKDLNANTLIVYIEEMSKARNELRGSFIQQLPLELAIIKLCSSIPAGAAPQTVRPSRLDPSAPPVSAPRSNLASQQAAGNMRGANISQDEIMAKWNEVLARIKSHNHSLSFILRVCKPQEINGRVLKLIFKYKFHKDRIEDAQIRQIVEKVLGEVYNTPITIEAVVDDNLEINNNVMETIKEVITPAEKKEDNTPAGGSAIDNLLRTFGGKVIK